LVRSVKGNWREQIASGDLKVEDLPEELQNLLELTGDKNNIEGVMGWIPKSEQEYMQGLIQMLPDTWVFSAIVGESQERAQQIAIMYLSVGRMDLLWDRIDVAAPWLLHQLRGGSQSAMDYMNYGHCLLLQGDRMMAYEYYRQARQLCKGPKEFFAIFRPDRHDLVEHGVPVEHVYMLEDKLLKL
jgi:tetratricopeptide (TPR) repeat protein